MSPFADCFRRVFLVCALFLAALTSRPASAQALAPPDWSPPWAAASQATLPADYVARVLPPIQRAAFAHRSAFGSLCSLAPLACALIDRPFAFNAKLELFIRPKAADGSTALLLPFAVSVPILGRAEVGLGSCYAMAWASADKSAASSPSPPATPTGLCPMWLAAKAVVLPFFRDPHKHPALAAEYLFEYQAGPFAGLNQLGLPGPLSKLSVMYRHPLGDLELSGAATVLLDHISRAGTLQLGAHAGYRVPFGEHLWVFGQAILQMPSWGPVLLDAQSGKTLDLSPPVGGTLAIGAQQRADFGFGVGLTVMFTKSDLETRVDLLFRLLSFEVGPHIKPLFPPKPKPEPAPKVEVALHAQAAGALCSPGMQPVQQPSAVPGAPQPVEPVQCVPIPPQRRQCPPGLVPAAPPSMECVMPRLAPPSPLWGHPCEFVPFDGSPHLRVGRIDRSGEYCEWDGLRLPLGAIIAPPQPGRANPEAAPPTSTAPNATAGPSSPMLASRPPTRAGYHGPGAPPMSAAPRTANLAPVPAQSGQTVHAATSAQATHPVPPAPRAGEHYDPRAASVPGSPAASGFVDGAAKAIHHVAQIAKVVHDHGIGAVVPSKEDATKWLHDFKEDCLDHAKDCVTHKAQEAADELNRFRKLSRDDQVYAVSSTLGEAAPGMLASAIVPGGGAVLGGVIRSGEKAAGKALLKKAGKEALEEVAEHTDEAAARRLLREAEERAKKEAEKRAAKEAAEAEARRAAEAQAKAASEAMNAAPSRHAPLGSKGEPIDTPRTVFRRGEPDGRVNHYQTFETPVSPRDPRPSVLTKRFDGVGESHNGVPTPHIHEPSKPGGPLDRVRHPPRPDELPRGYRP